MSILIIIIINNNNYNIKGITYHPKYLKERFITVLVVLAKFSKAAGFASKCSLLYYKLLYVNKV
jgi:hypothetical protein